MLSDVVISQTPGTDASFLAPVSGVCVIGIMPMTHAPETGARNRRQFSGTGFWRRFLERVSCALGPNCL